MRLIEQHFAIKAGVDTVNSAAESSRQEFDDKFEALRQGIKADFASLKSELIKWMIGTHLASATLLIAAIKVF